MKIMGPGIPTLMRRPYAKTIIPEMTVEAVCPQCGPISQVCFEQNILPGRVGRERMFCLKCGSRVKRSRTGKKGKR
jgi:hypothetical protein